MARFGILTAAVAGVLMSIAANAAPTPADTVPEQCNPMACMAFAVMHSDCVDGMNPGPFIPKGVPMVDQATQCVCADPKLKESYLNCNGFCTIDEANEPYCGKPVHEHASEDDKAKREETVDFKQLAHHGLPKPHIYTWCKGPACSTYDPRIITNFCGVMGQACGTKVVDDADTEDADVIDPEHPEITATAILPEHNDIVERDPKKKKSHTYFRWTNFCGVPGEACYDKVAAPTAAPGSDFVDVGDADSKQLEGKVGGDEKRAMTPEDPAPTTLFTVNDYLRPLV